VCAGCGTAWPVTPGLSIQVWAVVNPVAQPRRHMSRPVAIGEGSPSVRRARAQGRRTDAVRAGGAGDGTGRSPGRARPGAFLAASRPYRSPQVLATSNVAGPAARCRDGGEPLAGREFHGVGHQELPAIWQPEFAAPTTSTFPAGCFAGCRKCARGICARGVKPSAAGGIERPGKALVANHHCPGLRACRRPWPSRKPLLRCE